MACKINIDTRKPKIEISIKLKAVKKDYISLTSIKEESGEGPEFYADIQASQFEVKIDAMVTVLGIGVGVKIQVTNKQFIFTVKGKISRLFQAELTCKAAFGSLENSEFSVWHILLIYIHLKFLNNGLNGQIKGLLKISTMGAY